MHRFEKLLVNLSLTETDVPTLRLVSLISRLAETRQITFVYAREPIEIPEPLRNEYPWLVTPLDESTRERAETFIDEYFECPEDCTSEILLRDETPAVALLENSLTRDIDLLVTGDFDLDRSLPIKLARKASCSVLLVPAQSSGCFKRICLGLDLSEYSKYTLECASAFATANEIEELTCVNVFSVPHGVQKTKMPRTRLQQQLKELSRNRLSDFLRQHGTAVVKMTQQSISSPVPGSTLLSLSEKENYDLIVVGCRGGDALTATLLGSNTEDILKGAKTAAVLAVKEKGTGKAFLESLLKMASATT